MSAVTLASDETISKRLKLQYSAPPWRDDENLKKLLSTRDELRKSKAGNTREIKTITHQIMNRVKKLKNQHFEKEAHAINTLAITRDLEKMYARGKSQKSTLKSTNTAACNPEKLVEYFKSHLNPAIPGDRPPELDNPPGFIDELQALTRQADIDQSAPTIQEIQITLETLKNGKSANDFSPELVKVISDCPILLQNLHALLCKVWNDVDPPPAWANSKLQALWKGKGSKKDASKYRGLAIGGTMNKIAMSIILRRLQFWYEKQLTDHQYGFRRNRGTTDGIFVTKRVQQISNRKKQALYFLFVDLSAAFDHVVTSWLWASIRQRFPPDMSTLLIDILEKLYGMSTYTFSPASTTFETSSGVRQGGPESPLLFNLFIDYVMRIFVNMAEEKTSNSLSTVTI